MPRPPKYTDEELLEEIRRLFERLDRSPLLKRDMNEYGKHRAKTYQDRLGSWSNAVDAAGFARAGDGIPRATRCVSIV